MAEPEDSIIPTSEQLAKLSVRLMSEYEPTFWAAGMDLSIRRVRSMISRGIGLEINGEWDSFKAARWSLFKRRWVLVRGLPELEAFIRDYLDRELSSRPSS
jgi:hypothetical protein